MMPSASPRCALLTAQSRATATRCEPACCIAETESHPALRRPPQMRPGAAVRCASTPRHPFGPPLAAHAPRRSAFEQNRDTSAEPPRTPHTRLLPNGILRCPHPSPPQSNNLPAVRSRPRFTQAPVRVFLDQIACRLNVEDNLICAYLQEIEYRHRHRAAALSVCSSRVIITHLRLKTRSYSSRRLAAQHPPRRTVSRLQLQRMTATIFQPES
jgi:hypothetical protein